MKGIVGCQSGATSQKLPDERESCVHKFVIHAHEGDVKGYVIPGFYPDGRVGEVFVKLAQAGSTVSGFIDAWAIQVSKRLQMGAALESIIADHKGAKFEPAGATETPGIRFCSSPLDYVVRYLERRHVQKRPLKDENP